MAPVMGVALGSHDGIWHSQHIRHHAACHSCSLGALRSHIASSATHVTDDADDADDGDVMVTAKSDEVHYGYGDGNEYERRWD